MGIDFGTPRVNRMIFVLRVSHMGMDFYTLHIHRKILVQIVGHMGIDFDTLTHKSQDYDPNGGPHGGPYGHTFVIPFSRTSQDISSLDLRVRIWTRGWEVKS